MTLVIHAPNIHQGGGAILLSALLRGLGRECTVMVDQRFDLPWSLERCTNLVRVSPRIMSRFVAEWRLYLQARRFDTVLCFGNLPPLFPVKGKVYVYLQNRYVLPSTPIVGFSLRARLRIYLERLWLRFFLRDSTLVVQTQTMRKIVRNDLSVEALVLPFSPGHLECDGRQKKVFDFVYVASGESHKNHKNLVRAWDILADHGVRPSLCLTLDERRDSTLLSWVEERASRKKLNIESRKVSCDEIVGLYSKSAALIFPSLFESFGLPLVEARDCDLPILASEKDYVWDLVEPVMTFDPDSPESIARTVMRYLGMSIQRTPLRTAAEFIQELDSVS